MSMMFVRRLAFLTSLLLQQDKFVNHPPFAYEPSDFELKSRMQMEPFLQPFARMNHSQPKPQKPKKPDLHEGLGLEGVDEADVAQMASLIRENEKDSGLPLTEDQIREKLSNSEIVAWSKDNETDRIASVAVLKKRITGKDFQMSELGMLATQNDYRGQGLAGKLNSKLMSSAYEKGLDAVFSVTRVDNYSSLRVQLFDGIKGKLANNWKGISTVVAFAKTKQGDLFAILASPVGNPFNPVNYLSKKQKMLSQETIMAHFNPPSVERKYTAKEMDYGILKEYLEEHQPDEAKRSWILSKLKPNH